MSIAIVTPPSPAGCGALFPTLPGIQWGVQKSPQFNTVTHRAVSGYEIRAARMQYPLWTFTLSYEFLRDGAYAELKTLLGFFLQQMGSFSAFCYSDPSDNAVVNQSFATGDGATPSFQITRTYGGFVEPVQNLNGTPQIVVGGTLQAPTAFSIVNGLVSFATAPAAGAVLTWTGSFFYRVRFVDDHADFSQFMYQLYELKQLSFVGSPLNKV
ncbi:MAG: DUF2460 domain-containing protein [Betaproteobacteria bacterium]|nr:DUF2460 domain-containing protein [Betaproteobacteria bacterium]